MKKGIKVIGMDLALNHSAYIELLDGELNNFWYLTTKVGAANQSKRHGTRLKLLKTKDRQQRSVQRISDIVHYVAGSILSRDSLPDYAGIEDYALRAEQGAHYLGEAGGIVRHMIYSRRVKMRLHDPLSVKMFVAHDGTAQKDSIERAVKERWGIDFSRYNQPKSKPTNKNPDPKQNRETSEDLCDAYGVAKMIWTEILLRHGEILMKDLHPKEVQIFNRITKTYPVSLLDRDWIRKGHDE